jgi:hypothetical protein
VGSVPRSTDVALRLLYKNIFAQAQVTAKSGRIGRVLKTGPLSVRKFWTLTLLQLGEDWERERGDAYVTRREGFTLSVLLALGLE